MADFLSLDSLSIVLVFIVPGFVALSIRSQFVARESLSDNWERSLAYVAISVIYGTLVLWLVDLSLVAKSDFKFLGVVFLVPLCSAWSWESMLKKIVSAAYSTIFVYFPSIRVRLRGTENLVELASSGCW